MGTTQNDMIAELRRANAALQAKLDAALAQRGSEYDERIAHQAATIDVLKAMSASPGDPQPVFDLIVRLATELCDGIGTALYEYDGRLIHYRAFHGPHAWDSEAATNYRALFPMAPSRQSASSRAVLEKRIVHVRDIEADADMDPRVRAATPPPTVAVPMMRDDGVIGVISLSGERGGFSDRQIELLKTFAGQAAIAITSAETYRALRERTADLQESLEYQTATGDVLKVISRSTFDLQPVLDTVVQTAARLCDADQAVIFRREGEASRLAANFGFPAEYLAHHMRIGPIPFDPDNVSAPMRSQLEGRIVHIPDVTTVPGYPEVVIRLGRQRTALGVPLRREGETIGVILLARQRVEPFTDRQIELITTFADQAVIAMENARLLTEQREALEQQTATAEVLQVINASPGNLTPVFKAILENAHRVCGAEVGGLILYQDGMLRAAATRGFPPVHEEFLRRPFPPSKVHDMLIAGGRIVHFPDMRTIAIEDDNAVGRNLVERTELRACLMVPLRKDGALLGFLSAYRFEPRAFDEKQIALLENFAAQAEIAMENARLIGEQREALEQQTATAEVLGVINGSPGDLTPVFDAMLERALRLCGAAFGIMYTFDGERFEMVATKGVPDAFEAFRRQHPMRASPSTPPGNAITALRPVQVADVMTDPFFVANPDLQDIQINLGGIRAVLNLPLIKDGAAVGMFVIYRKEPGEFSTKQIALLENFGAQAVIAMENARLLKEIRQRQEELRITFENMGDGVAMFDETQNLVAWNRKFQDILEVPDEIIAQRRSLPDYIRYLAERGEFGRDADVEEQVRRVLATTGQMRVFERVRPNGRVIEIHSNPVPGGGFVLIYSDITERKRDEAEIAAARDAAQEAARTIETAFRELKTAQANLIQAEKMASLGQLTAGIAHEIKNPLNFVNNFAELSVDLLAELKDAMAPAEAALTEEQRAEIDDVSALLTSNLRKITEHGKRADGIVKAMLEHSRGESGERREVDINALVDEALNLAYHGARAQDQSFNVALERDFAVGIAPIEVNPRDMTRVFLNLFSNGFYAANKRARNGAAVGFDPALTVVTRDAGDAVEIRVRDNGTGIPHDVRDKLFQPFFTTKPTGEGTGLGLSITYDIVTKAHGGTISVASEVDSFTEFVVTLPRRMFAREGDGDGLR